MLRPRADTMPAVTVLAQPEWAADGDGPIADPRLGVGELDERQIVRLDLQQGEVGLRIAANQLGFKGATVLEANANRIGTGDHVVVGHDVAVGRNGEARADASHLALMRTPLAVLPMAMAKTLSAIVVEEPLELPVARRLVGSCRHRTYASFDLDANHGRSHAVDDIGKAHGQRAGLLSVECRSYPD